MLLPSLGRFSRRGAQEDVGGGWMRLHSEDWRTVCSLPNIVRMMKSARIIGAM
jgi:hypothetical protein